MKQDGEKVKRNEKRTRKKKKKEKEEAAGKSEISVNYDRRVYAIGHTPHNVNRRVSVESIRRKEEKMYACIYYERYMCKYTQNTCTCVTRTHTHTHSPTIYP